MLSLTDLSRPLLELFCLKRYLHPKQIFAAHNLGYNRLLNSLSFLLTDHTFPIIWSLFYHGFRHLLDQLGPIATFERCVCVSKELAAGDMPVFCRVAQWSLALLVRPRDKLSCLFEDVFENFELAISGCKVHDCVSKLVCKVNFCSFILIKCVQDLFGAHLSGDKNSTLLELVLNIGVNSSNQQIMNHLFLVTFCGVVKQTFSKSVDIVNPVLLILDGLQDIYQPQLRRF